MLALWKKSYEKSRWCIKKQRHHFANKGPYSQSYGFLIVMYGCESWTTKKVGCQKIDVFELWYWRRLLGVPWTVRISNQSILREINPMYSREGLTLKLKTPILWIPDVKVDSLAKTLMLGKTEGRRRRGRQRMRWSHSTTNSMDMNMNKFWQIVEDAGASCAAVHGVAKSWT